MILAAPLVIPFAEAVGLSVATLGMAKVADMVNEYIQENPEQSIKILSTIVPGVGIGEIFMKKGKDEEVEEDIEVEDVDARDLTKKEKAKKMKEIVKEGGNLKETMKKGYEEIILPGKEDEMLDEAEDRYEGGVEEVSKPKFDYKKFFKKRYADGGSIGIEVLFEPKRKDFNIGGQAQKTNTTPYDARASVQDYAAAMQKVGAGTDAQKLQAIGEYGLNQMQNSPSYFKAVGQGINQHMLNNQMLRDAFDAKRITEDQYKLMGGYDVAQLTPKIGLGNIKIGGTPGDVGIASAIYNAIKAGGIGAEKLGIKETDPYNQYGDIGFFGSIAKNYQGAKGLSESDKTLYESIISGKTQSDIDRFRSGLYAANQVDKTTGDRLYGGNIENLFEQYKKNPSTFFYAGDDTQNMYDRFNKYYADGGRVGLFMGGDPLTGQALSIYNSMKAYDFTDQQIADALAAQGLYGGDNNNNQVTTVQDVINQNANPSGSKLEQTLTSPGKLKEQYKAQLNSPINNAIYDFKENMTTKLSDPTTKIGKLGINASNILGSAIGAVAGIPGLGFVLDKLSADSEFDRGAIRELNSPMQLGVYNKDRTGTGYFTQGPIQPGISSLSDTYKSGLTDGQFAGVTVDDLGRIQQTGDYNTAENVMAGYNAGFDLGATAFDRYDKIDDTIEKEKEKANVNYAKIKSLQKRQQALTDFALANAAAQKAAKQAAIDRAIARGNKEAEERARVKSITAGYGGHDDRPGATGPTAAGAGMGIGGGYASDYGFLKDGGLATMFKEKR